MEVWREIDGFVGLYEVSDQGRVRSLRGRHGIGIILNPRLPDDHRQYMAVSLHKDGKRTRRRVHSLVARAFLPPRPSPKHEVRHYDGDRSNNRVGNILWGTRAQNAADRERHGRAASGDRHGMFGRGLHGQMNGVAKLSDDAVREIRSLAGSMKQRDIATKFDVTQGVVWRVIHKKAWSHVE